MCAFAARGAALRDSFMKGAACPFSRFAPAHGGNPAIDCVHETPARAPRTTLFVRRSTCCLLRCPFHCPLY